jgi:hypothetical protein
MAQQVHSAECSQAMMIAHNSSHSLLAGGFPHYDGPEYGPDASGSPARTPVQLLGTAMPNSAAEAAALIIAAKDFVNAHFNYADEVLGEKWYAHKVKDLAHLISSVMGSWSTVEAAMLEAARILVNDMCTKYEAHRLNQGGSWHSLIDTNNNVGTPLTFTALQWTGQVGIERTNYLKALFNDHIVLTAGGVHSAADVGNVVTAANALYSGITGPDWSTWLTLLADLRTKLIAHPPTVVHNDPDLLNIVTAPLPTVPAGTFDLVNELLTDWNLHVVDVAYHDVADGGNQTVLLVVTNIGEMITAAQQLYTAINAHVEAAPISRSIRRVA